MQKPSRISDKMLTLRESQLRIRAELFAEFLPAMLVDRRQPNRRLTQRCANKHAKAMVLAFYIIKPTFSFIGKGFL
jgi:hypothetical protein